MSNLEKIEKYWDMRSEGFSKGINDELKTDYEKWKEKFDLLLKNATGKKVLDIGCGSGILGIASLLLGAEYADMVDIDPNAVKIVTENADMNNIPHEKYEVMAGNILDDEKLHEKYSGKKYDVVEANIVADVIVALSPMVPNFIKDNGIFICSGIIDTRLDDVLKALGENGFEVLETKTRKDWCAVASRYTGR